MPKIIAALLCSALLAGCASTFGEKWSKTDTNREILWQGVNVIDWGQTRYIAKHPEKYQENNPIIGKHPSTGAVDIYMASSALLHPIAAAYLKPKYRKWFQYITIGMSGGCVLNNVNIGVKIGF